MGKGLRILALRVSQSWACRERAGGESAARRRAEQQRCRLESFFVCAQGGINLRFAFLSVRTSPRRGSGKVHKLVGLGSNWIGLASNAGLSRAGSRGGLHGFRFRGQLCSETSNLGGTSTDAFRGALLHTIVLVTWHFPQLVDILDMWGVALVLKMSIFRHRSVQPHICLGIVSLLC